MNELLIHSSFTEALDMPQLMGFAAMIVMVAGYAAKKDRRVNQIWIASNTLWVAHYMMLHAWSGAANCAIHVIRCLGALYLTQPRFKIPTFWVVAAAYIAMTIPFAEKLVDWLPLAGSLLTCIAFYIVKPGLTCRIYILFSVIAWLLYTISQHSIGGMIAFSVSVLITLSMIYRLWRESRPA